MLKKIYLLLAPMLFCANLAQAQQPLSLADAIQKGLENNFDIRIAESQVADATQLNEWGQAGRYPTINFQVRSNNNSQFNQPASPFAIAGTNVSNNISGALNVNWILFNGFRVKFTKMQLDKLQAQSEMQAANTIEQNVERIILAYYNVLLQEENLKVLGNVLQLSKDRVDFVRIQRELGSGTSFDVSREETTFFNDSSVYINQELIVENTFRDLNVLMGVEDLEQGYELTDRFSFDPQAYVFDDLLNKMKSSNSNLQRQYRALEVSKVNTRIQNTNRIPTIAIDLGYNGNTNWFTADFPAGLDTEGNPIIQRDTRNGYAYGPYGNLTVSVPIYAGGRNNRAVQTAKLNMEQQQIATDQLQLTLANELKQTHEEYNNRIEQVRLTEQSLDAADLNLRLSQEQLELGTINSFDFRTVQISYLNAAFRALSAKFNMVSSHTRLLRLTGGILDTE